MIREQRVNPGVMVPGWVLSNKFARKRNSTLPEIKTSILIVGQGLAGSILAHTLYKRKLDFFVIDKPGLSTCSMVAAGIWNPIVFKRMTSSWMAREVLPVMHELFSGAEQLLGQKLLSRRKIMKFFTEKQEAELWVKKVPGLYEFIDGKIYDSFELNIDGINKPRAGFSFVQAAGNIETVKFLEGTRNWLIKKNCFLGEFFDRGALEKIAGGYKYKDIFAEHIVFCRGYTEQENPDFNFVKFRPAKGEVLTFECPELETEHILHKGVFILPLGNGYFKCGATYEWNALSQVVTNDAQRALEEKLRQVVKLPFKVVDRSAGIRPAVIDRRPVIGEHPVNKNMWLFNGFGTKAVMLAPYFANEWINFTEGIGGINPEASIQRFIRK